MPIPTSLVGMTVEPMRHEVDERWTMAYAAALSDHNERYFDTTSSAGVVAHPVFAVCPEWPVIVSSRSLSEQAGVPQDEVITSVHATHDVTIHRLVRPGDVLTTSLEMTGMVQKSPGAMSSTRLTTVDASGAAVATTTQNGIYLGVPTSGEDRVDAGAPTPISSVARRGEPHEVRIAVAAGAAHTYTECARIWNPIHTDKAVALRAGLPDIILHGTANLAHGVTAVIDHVAGGDPELVRRVTCRFAAMVRLPSTMTAHIWEPVVQSDGTQVVPFEVLNGGGEPAVKDGYVILGTSP